MLKRVKFVHIKHHPALFCKLILISKINSKSMYFFASSMLILFADVPFCYSSRARRRQLSLRMPKYRRINLANTPKLLSTTLLKRIALKLSSALQPNTSALCLYGLPDKEWHLCLAQVNDSLSDLRRQLHITTGLWQYKKTQILILARE
jgi:hypothetical protein